MRKTGHRLARSGGALGLVVAAAVAPGAPRGRPIRRPSPGLPTIRRADRQAFLEAGARREGALLVYTVGAQIDPVVKAFNAKYPFLAVKTFKNDIPTLLAKTFEEYKAGVYNTDVFEIDDYGLRILTGRENARPVLFSGDGELRGRGGRAGQALDFDAGGLRIARLQHRCLCARPGAANPHGSARSEVEGQAKRIGHRIHARKLGRRPGGGRRRGFRPQRSGGRT